LTAVVKAQDGTTIIYTVNITRAASTADANIAYLSISAGSLSPAYAPATVNYTDTVTNATASLTVTAVASNSSATIKVNGTTVTNGSASGAIALVGGSNNIKV